MKTLLLLDFDRTVFDLSSFLGDVREHLWGLPPDKLTGGRGEDDILDIFDRPSAYPDSAHQALKEATKRLPHKNYAYKDAVALLKHLPEVMQPAIITFGLPERQNFKRQFAPAIKDLPFIVTEQNKGLLLVEGVRKHWLGGVKVDLPQVGGRFDQVVLIDDNPVSFLPPAEQYVPLTMIHLARPGERYSEEPVPAGVRRIASLSEYEPGITG